MLYIILRLLFRYLLHLLFLVVNQELYDINKLQHHLNGYSGDNDQATSATLNYPVGVAVDLSSLKL